MAALLPTTHSRNTQIAETSFSEKVPSSNLPMPQDQASSPASLNGRAIEVKELPTAAETGCLATVKTILTTLFDDVEISSVREALHKAAGKGHEKIVHYLLSKCTIFIPQIDREKALQKLEEVKFEKATLSKSDNNECVIL